MRNNKFWETVINGAVSKGDVDKTVQVTGCDLEAAAQAHPALV